MPCSDDAPLEQRKRRFNGVGVNVAVNVHLHLVLDRLVLRGHVDALHGRGIGVQFVGHNYVNVGDHVLSAKVRLI
jgi:hypothetical protein